MIIKSPIIPRLPDYDSFCDGKWYFCGDSLKEYFTVPKKATHIQFLASRKQKRDWVPVSFESDHYCPFSNIHVDGEERSEWILRETAQEVEKKLEKAGVWYVCLYYWVKE